MNAVPSMSMRLLAVALLGVSMLSAGCSSVNKLLGNEESIDYRSAEQGPPNLTVPPDLTQLSREDRYQVPAGRASTTFSTYSANQDQQRPGPTSQTVLPQQQDISVQRDGNQRWLLVNRPAEQLYPVVREFWQELGFMIRVERPEAGVMETDWAENRAKLPQDFIRNTLGKILDSVYSTGELDKFRTRLERSGNGGATEIYITHQGMVETLTGADKTQTKWTARPSDPELEAEFMRRLMVRLGTDAERAKASVERPQQVASAVKVNRVSGSGTSGELQLNENFDRAWRSVGLALDRGGFSVVDRDRSQGTYFVRYVDPDVNAPQEKGFFSRMFSFGGGNDPKSQPQYRLKLVGGEGSTRIQVQNADGGPENSRAGARILDVLADQLK